MFHKKRSRTPFSFSSLLSITVMVSSTLLAWNTVDALSPEKHDSPSSLRLLSPPSTPRRRTRMEIRKGRRNRKLGGKAGGKAGGGNSGGSGGGSGGGGSGSGGSATGNFNDWQGCLNYNDDQLHAMWASKFDGSEPACDFAHPGESQTVKSGQNSGGDGGTYNNAGDASAASDNYNGNNNGGNNNNGGGNDNANNGGNNGGNDDANNDDDAGNGQNVQNAYAGDYEYDDQNNVQDDDNGGNQGNDDGGGQDDDQNDEAKGYSNQYYDPHQDFSIQQCNTYEDLWLWDLALTCESQESLENCQCAFADELMSQGILSCSDVSNCPSRCGICRTCLQLLGCGNTAAGINASMNTIKAVNGMFFVLAGAVAVAIATAIMLIRRRRSKHTALGDHLMDAEADDMGNSPDSGAASAPVWLAPEMPPAQFEPSHVAAMESHSTTSDQPESAESSAGQNIDLQTPSRQPAEGGVWLAPVMGSSASQNALASNEDNVWLAPVT